MSPNWSFGLCGLLACLLVFISGAEAETVELYSNRYDHVDVDGILNSHRLREQYYDCFVKDSSCLTADAKFFKAIFPEAIVTQCRKCTLKQKENLSKIIEYYSKKEPKKWQRVLEVAIQKYQKQHS